MSKRNKIHFRKAIEKDVDIYYTWANDKVVRENSYNNDEIVYDKHVNWFLSKLKSVDCNFYIFFDDNNHAIGQVRIDKSNNEIVIGISIDEKYRGRSLGTEMLNQATVDYLLNHKNETIVAYVKVENTASVNSFKKAGFKNEKLVVEQGFESYKLYKKLDS